MFALDRRRLLVLMGSSLLSGCVGIGGSNGGSTVALLLPLKEAPAGLAEKMRRAAESAVGQPNALMVFDTHGTPAGAAAAARQAVSAGATIILGPVFAHEVEPVVAESGTIPVLTFSNDGELTGGGAFIFGVTPAQSIGPVFAFARTQGVRKVAIVAYDGPWGRQAIAAGRALAPRAGLSLVQAITIKGTDDLGQLAARLRQGDAPDAILLPDGGNAVPPLGQALAASGVQLLGSSQWSDLDGPSIPALRGAWYAAPDPTGIDSNPKPSPIGDRAAPASSLLTALAHDAASIAAALAGERNFSRSSIERPAGFATSLGRVRFADDGSVERDLAIMGISADGVHVLSKAA